MKVIISPSKTMKMRLTNDPLSTPMFAAHADNIINWLKSKTSVELKSYYKISDKLTAQVINLLEEFNNDQSPAIFSYTGTQFQYMGLDTITISELSYLKDHIYIVSGLYGLLKPFDGISRYRLPMELSYQGQSLSEYWRTITSDVLRNELIIDLSSDEYSNAILFDQLTYVKIEFRAKQPPHSKVHAMEAKKMRGVIINYIVKNKINDVEVIKNFSCDGYLFDEILSSSNSYVFTK